MKTIYTYLSIPQYENHLNAIISMFSVCRVPFYKLLSKHDNEIYSSGSPPESLPSGKEGGQKELESGQEGTISTSYPWVWYDLYIISHSAPFPAAFMLVWLFALSQVAAYWERVGLRRINRKYFFIIAICMLTYHK